MTIKIFAITTRGIEKICSNELKQLTGIEIREIAYRRIAANFNGDLHSLLSLKTIDDIFIDLAEWDEIPLQRSGLEIIQKKSAQLKINNGAAIITQIRSISKNPIFSVTANFVGKRNYSFLEIKRSVSEGIMASSNWNYTENDTLSDVNIRVFIEHEKAYIGLRLGKESLQKRWYKNNHISGSLKPPVAAAMVSLIKSKKNTCIVDPFCGAGTILIEACLNGFTSMGGDNNPDALIAAQANARIAGVNINLCHWNAKVIPFPDQSVENIVTNFPWDRQIKLTENIEFEYSQFCSELNRILRPHGQAVILTNFPDLIKLPNLQIELNEEISLFGQRPSIVMFAPKNRSTFI